MCGIIGLFNADNAEAKVIDTLKLFRNRGSDACGIATDKEIQIADNANEIKVKSSKNAFGHTLHSMVSFIPQPIQEKKGIIVSNCEIYNWKELANTENIGCQNDSELLVKLFEKYNGIDDPIKILAKLDGVFAFAYWQDNKVVLARDLIGVKPLWYSIENGLAFASEKKALKKHKYNVINELNPRTVLVYDIINKETKFLRRDFFKNTPEHNQDHKTIKEHAKGLLINAIAKRIPDGKFGLLFSGGVDSTTIAIILQKLGIDFTCYTAAMTGDGLKEPEDLTYSRRIAKEYGLDLKEIKIDINDVEPKIKKTIKLIEDNNVVKIGVGLAFLSVVEQAKNDGIRVMFSGLGSEEIFAGYERHKNSIKINDECLSGLLKMYERDLYRDDVITMNHNIELRLPFLDKKLVEYSLKIPSRHKLSEKQNKIIVREIAEDLGLKEEFAQRKKRAAQYGSRFDQALSKIAKKNGFSKKSDYLAQFLKEKNLKLAILLSGGKDSNYAMHLMKRQNYDIACAITIKSKNMDSYMFHTPAINMATVQAKAIGIPIIEAETTGQKEKELDDLKIALEKAKKEYKIDGIITGAIFSNYQRERIENVADLVGLKIFSPLWHTNQKTLMEQLIAEGFEIILTSIAAYGLDRSWLGKVLTYGDIERLSELEKKYQINVAGEGGEFESLVLNQPMFSKKIVIRKSKIEMENENTGRLNIIDYGLADKEGY